MTLKEFFIKYATEQKRSFYTNTSGHYKLLYIKYDPKNLLGHDVQIIDELINKDNQYILFLENDETNWIFHQVMKESNQFIIDFFNYITESPLWKNHHNNARHFYEHPVYLKYLLIPDVLEKISFSYIKKAFSLLKNSKSIEQMMEALVCLPRWQEGDNKTKLVELLREKKQYILYNRYQDSTVPILALSQNTKVDTFIVNYALMRQSHNISMDESSLDKSLQRYFKDVLIQLKKVKNKVNFLNSISLGLTRTQIADNRKIYVDHTGPTAHAQILVSNLIDDFIQKCILRENLTPESLNTLLDKTAILIQKETFESQLKEKDSPYKTRKI